LINSVSRFKGLFNCNARIEVSMSFAKLVCAALVLLVTTSCTTTDTRTANAAPSPECRQTEEKDHPLEKVGRTIFWLEIKLMEQARKTSPECDAKPE
jgi:hypothetical protein